MKRVRNTQITRNTKILIIMPGNVRIFHINNMMTYLTFSLEIRV